MVDVLVGWRHVLFVQGGSDLVYGVGQLLIVLYIYTYNIFMRLVFGNLLVLWHLAHKGSLSGLIILGTDIRWIELVVAYWSYAMRAVNHTPCYSRLLSIKGLLLTELSLFGHLLKIHKSVECVCMGLGLHHV